MPAHSSRRLRSISLPFSIYNLGTRLLTAQVSIPPGSRSRREPFHWTQMVRNEFGPFQGFAPQNACTPHLRRRTDLLTAAAGFARSPCRFPYTIWGPACSPRSETGEALPVADEASLFRGRLPISGYAGSADWFEPTVYSLLGYLRAKSRICGGELTCLQQPQAPLDLLAVFHIQSGDPFAHRTGQYPTGISIPAGALSLDSNGPK